MGNVLGSLVTGEAEGIGGEEQVGDNSLSEKRL